MKCLVLLVATVAIVTAAVPAFPGDNSHYREGDQYIWFPDGDNIPVLADLYEVPQPETSLTRDRGANNAYYLYTRLNPSSSQRLYLDDSDTLRNSNFDARKITKLIIHGWRSNQGSNINTLILQALMEEGDYNVIVVDWSHTSGGTYTNTVGRVVSIGEYVGRFLQFLNANGNSYANIHLIGHSLGAHISGIAGRHVGAQVGRITGLDPAGPLWPNNANKLTKESALFVEVIHTDSGWLGYWDPCGHADFYPNGGHSQPGCWLSTCHHSRAYELYAATIRYNHLQGNECNNVNEATSRACGGEKTEFMGNTWLRKDNHGIFRMETSRRYPYSL